MDSCGLVCSTRIFVVFIHILMVSDCAIFFIAISQQFIYKFILISFGYVPAYCPCNKKHIECHKIQMDEGKKKKTIVEGKETEYGESGTIIINSQDYS